MPEYGFLPDIIPPDMRAALQEFDRRADEIARALAAGVAEDNGNKIGQSERQGQLRPPAFDAAIECPSHPHARCRS